MLAWAASTRTIMYYFSFKVQPFLQITYDVAVNSITLHQQKGRNVAAILIYPKIVCSMNIESVKE